jgi:hypothetical protein
MAWQNSKTFGEAGVGQSNCIPWRFASRPKGAPGSTVRPSMQTYLAMFELWHLAQMTCSFITLERPPAILVRRGNDANPIPHAQFGMRANYRSFITALKLCPHLMSRVTTLRLQTPNLSKCAHVGDDHCMSSWCTTLCQTQQPRGHTQHLD